MDTRTLTVFRTAKVPSSAASGRTEPGGNWVTPTFMTNTKNGRKNMNRNKTTLNRRSESELRAQAKLAALDVLAAAAAARLNAAALDVSLIEQARDMVAQDLKPAPFRWWFVVATAMTLITIIYIIAAIRAGA